jgi:hypothetical protein
MTTSAQWQERRRSPRIAERSGTFVQRLLLDQELPTLHVDVVDYSREGVGVVSLMPLHVGDRVAIGLTRNWAQHQLALCRVQHSDKAPSGQFRSGLEILDRIPGDPARTRAPQHWRFAASA